MTGHDRQRSQAIGAFSAALVVAAALLLAGPLRHLPAPPGGLSWWMLVPAFTAAELVVVHVQARRESLSVSFAEIPLVVGLVFLGPMGLVGARVVGSALGLLHRRQAGLKLFFNLSMFAFEASLACTLYHLLRGGADSVSLRGLVAAFVTVAVTDLVAASALTTVIWLKVGEFDEGVLAEAVTTGLVAALTNTSVGLLVVILVESHPVALVLLIPVVATLALAYRGYSTLSRAHAHLEALYRFTRQVQREEGTDFVAEIVLRQARDVLSAHTAELIVLPIAGDGLHLHLIDDEMHHRPVDVAAWLAPARAGRPVLRRGGGDAAGPRDALAAPLEVDGVVVALLVVQDRPHHLGPFTADDLQLLESLANHAAVALHKSRLVGQLRTDAATQEHASLHDALTGLPNRRHALLALTAELAASMNTAVLVLDLDGFTQVNEAFGYAVGDRVLRETGRRLALHATEPGQVARLGNDEFVIVLRDVADADDAVRRAEEILGSLSAPVTFDGLSLDVRGCAGLAAAPAHGADAELLLQRADAAMYAAKRDRATLRVWDPVTEGDSARRLVLLGHLRAAVAARQLTVHYQPKVALGSGQVVGAEALARWEHPDHGRVCPDEFIPLAEHAGLIVPLTDQVLAAALAQCALWRVSVPGFTMAVNLSARSLVDPDLPAQVGAALDRAALPGAALMLEITETAIMTDLDRALVVLRGIEALGVRLSIDDFGTGQSSLAYLKLLPVHEVKVDRSFVHGAAADAQDAAIVRSVINLGHALGLSVVAEGIEEAEQHRLLALWGCDMAQGYHISRPLPAAEFSAWLARGLRPTSVTRQRGQPSSQLAPTLPIGARRRSLPAGEV